MEITKIFFEVFLHLRKNESEGFNQFALENWLQKKYGLTRHTARKYVQRLFYTFELENGGVAFPMIKQVAKMSERGRLLPSLRLANDWEKTNETEASVLLGSATPLIWGRRW